MSFVPSGPDPSASFEDTLIMVSGSTTIPNAHRYYHNHKFRAQTTKDALSTSPYLPGDARSGQSRLCSVEFGEFKGGSPICVSVWRDKGGYGANAYVILPPPSTSIVESGVAQELSAVDDVPLVTRDVVHGKYGTAIIDYTKLSSNPERLLDTKDDPQPDDWNWVPRRDFFAGSVTIYDPPQLSQESAVEATNISQSAPEIDSKPAPLVASLVNRDDMYGSSQPS